MAASFLELEIAKRKLKIRDSTAFLSFVTTLWRGEIVMCSFSHTNNEIIGIFCNYCFDHEELGQLEKIIKDYLLN